MQVKSKPGTKCPKEGKPRKYIEDAGFVTVPDTAYYKRLVRDGSLVMGKAKGTHASPKASGFAHREPQGRTTKATPDKPQGKEVKKDKGKG